eukprot:1044270-Prorocentrum_lima.AAC.1
MPFVFENDSTVFADAAGRVQLRDAPPAGQPETTQQHPFLAGSKRDEASDVRLPPMGAMET